MSCCTRHTNEHISLVVTCYHVTLDVATCYHSTLDVATCYHSTLDVAACYYTANMIFTCFGLSVHYSEQAGYVFKKCFHNVHKKTHYWPHMSMAGVSRLFTNCSHAVHRLFMTGQNVSD